MTKEEYKKNLIRMWDSIRDDEHKGVESCGRRKIFERRIQWR